MEDRCVRTLYPCHHGSDILKYCEKLNLNKISDLVLLNEESWRTQEETRQKALEIWDNIKDCVYKSINKKGILPGGLNVTRRASEMNEKLLGTDLQK